MGWEAINCCSHYADERDCVSDGNLELSLNRRDFISMAAASVAMKGSPLSGSAIPGSTGTSPVVEATRGFPLSDYTPFGYLGQSLAYLGHASQRNPAVAARHWICSLLSRRPRRLLRLQTEQSI